MQKELPISIIIPTLNEEKTLPRLLESIENQEHRPVEVIVADGKSKDKTREIARKHHAIVVEGGIPAVGRNNGAKASRAEFLIFMDADSAFNKPLDLQKAYESFDKSKFTLAYAQAGVYPGATLFDRVFVMTLNTYRQLNFWYAKLFGKVTGGSGYFIMVSRELFDKLNGFDEKLYNIEDTDFAVRALKIGAKQQLLNTKIKYSTRRYKKVSLGKLLKISYFLALYKITKLFGLKTADKFFAKYTELKGPLGGK